MIRRHHPLLGEQLPVLQVLNGVLVVQLRDGSSLRVLRSWTDADGGAAPQPSDGNGVLTVSSLRDLMVTVSALKGRA